MASDYQTSPCERWADVPGYAGAYQISDQGNLRQVLADGRVRYHSPTRIKGKEFYAYDLVAPAGARRPRRAGKKRIAGGRFVRRHYVHRLVYDVFVGKALRTICVRHKDGDKANNRADNLEAIPVALARPRHAGETHACSKLRWSDIDEIRQLRAEGATMAALAKLKGITVPMVSRIVRGTAWREDRREFSKRA
jgi:hypothetical protein